MKRLLLAVTCLAFAGICLAETWTVTSVAATSSGNTGGAYCELFFWTSSDWSGTINGAAFPASAWVRMGQANENGKTVQQIAFTRSAGTLYITKTRCQ